MQRRRREWTRRRRDSDRVRHAARRHQGGIVNGGAQRFEIAFSKSIIDLLESLRLRAALLLCCHTLAVLHALLNGHSTVLLVVPLGKAGMARNTLRRTATPQPAPDYAWEVGLELLI